MCSHTRECPLKAVPSPPPYVLPPGPCQAPGGVLGSHVSQRPGRRHPGPWDWVKGAQLRAWSEGSSGETILGYLGVSRVVTGVLEGPEGEKAMCPRR